MKIAEKPHKFATREKVGKWNQEEEDFRTNLRCELNFRLKSGLVVSRINIPIVFEFKGKSFYYSSFTGSRSKLRR